MINIVKFIVMTVVWTNVTNDLLKEYLIIGFRNRNI